MSESTNIALVILVALFDSSAPNGILQVRHTIDLPPGLSMTECRELLAPGAVRGYELDAGDQLAAPVAALCTPQGGDAE